MKVFVTGATGVLGRRLVSALVDRGHEVHGLARDDAGERLVADRGGDPRRGDVLEAETLSAAVDEDVDVLVHAATAIPAGTDASAADWERNDRIRRDGVRNLLAAAGEGVDRVVFPSVVWLARREDGEPFDEGAARNPSSRTQSAADVERLLEERAPEASWEPLVLRFGYFYAPDAAHTRLFGELLCDRDFPIVGGGLLGRQDATFSWIHADDAATAAATAIDRAETGLYHVVDDEPATVAAFQTELADLLDAPAPRRVPGWLARFFVGAGDVHFFTSSMPTSNDAFAAATGWEPTYSTYREGLRSVVETWEDDGLIEATDAGYEWVGE